jgi:hypothetical protein
MDFLRRGCNDPSPQLGEDQMAKSTRNTGKPWTSAEVNAGTDEAGHAFQFEAGRVFRSEAGHPWRQSHGSI